MLEQLKENWIVFVPILGVMITASIAYLVGRPRWYAKLDEQYQKVWAPLHRLIYFNGDWKENINDPQKRQEIENIFHENYCLVPQYMIKRWKKKEFIGFARDIDSGFKYAAWRLGYTKLQGFYVLISILGALVVFVFWIFLYMQ